MMCPFVSVADMSQKLGLTPTTASTQFRFTEDVRRPSPSCVISVVITNAEAAALRKNAFKLVRSFGPPTRSILLDLNGAILGYARWEDARKSAPDAPVSGIWVLEISESPLNTIPDSWVDTATLEEKMRALIT